MDFMIPVVQVLMERSIGRSQIGVEPIDVRRCQHQVVVQITDNRISQGSIVEDFFEKIGDVHILIPV